MNGAGGVHRLKGCSTLAPFLFQPDANFRFRLGPKPPAATKPLHEPPVVSEDDPSPMIGHVGGLHEGLDFREKRGHADHIARSSVRVNARSNVSARHAPACDYAGMENGWETRLREVIKADGRSMNELSEAAGLGRNYVQQMLTYEKRPGADKLAQLLDALGEAQALYVYTGLRVTADELAFLSLVSQMTPKVRDRAIAMFRALVEPEQSQAS